MVNLKNKKIIIAPDSFKGSLNSIQVSEAIKTGIQSAKKNIEVLTHPVADGGEGSITIINKYFTTEKIDLFIHDPLFKKKKAFYLFNPNTQTAYIELAQASGLTQQTKAVGCLYTSTFGTGELINHAIKKQAQTIYLFVGGSATTDGGVGLAGALGFKFLTNIKTLTTEELIGNHLKEIKQIVPPANISTIRKISFKLINDVENVLYGKRGAAYIFAPQKGANPYAVKILDQGLKNLGSLFGKDISKSSGSGAAGGVGAGTKFFLHAQQISGINFFIKETSFQNIIKNAHLVITGEGKLDRQTSYGKVVSGIAKVVKEENIPLMVVCGQNKASTYDLKKMHVKKVFSILDKCNSVEQAIKNTRKFLIAIGYTIANELAE